MTIVITSGEPAGIGPDIILKAAASNALPCVVLGDIDLFSMRACMLGLDIQVLPFLEKAFVPKQGRLYVQHLPVRQAVVPGLASAANADYVLAQLDAAVIGCMSGHYFAMVTAPVAKSIICEAGYCFSGHTDYIAQLTQTSHLVVMMLACEQMRVALVTTHIPLKEVSSAITPLRLEQTILTLQSDLKRFFGIEQPKIMVAGLNPHAGENGYLGREEIDVIAPVLAQFDHQHVIGPMAADTMFSIDNCKQVDAFVAMYHDQGLAVLKYAGFGNAANISLGLPIIRTSVDHGTAFSLAGTLSGSEGSLLYAIQQAKMMHECSTRDAMV